MLVRGAPLRNQCSKPYFYGRDLNIEKLLQVPEGAYNHFVSLIEERKRLDRPSRSFMTSLALLQHLRTDVSIRTTLAAQKEFAELVFERDPDQRPPDMTQDEVCHMAMDVFREQMNVLDDLRVAILFNDTSLPFVTSDNPAVHFNKLYANRSRFNAYGLMSAGYVMYLPLAPHIALLAYDNDVYKDVAFDGSNKPIKSTRLVNELNEVVAIHAMENIYIQDLHTVEYLRSMASRIDKIRNQPRHRLNYSIKDADKSDGTHTVYRVVHTSEERLEGDEALIHLESLPRHPERFPSIIQYRLKPRYIDTGTGAGFVRLAHRRSLQS